MQGTITHPLINNLVCTNNSNNTQHLIHKTQLKQQAEQEGRTRQQVHTIFNQERPHDAAFLVFH
jgi:hypothetical protein